MPSDLPPLAAGPPTPAPSSAPPSTTSRCASTRQAVLAAVLVFIGLLGGLSGLFLEASATFESNILALLPRTEQDPVVEEAARHFTDQAARRQLWLFGHPDFAEARAAAEAFAEQLRHGHDGFETVFDPVTGPAMDNPLPAIYALYSEHRYTVLPSATRLRLAEHDGAGIIDDARRLLYAPGVSGLAGQLEADPLLLLPQFIAGMPRGPLRMELHEGVATVSDGEMRYVMVVAHSVTSPFARRAQLEQGAVVDVATAELHAKHPDVTLLNAGVLKFARRTADSAQHDMTLIGIGSTIGIVLLLLLVFRSLWLVGVSLLPIAIGLLAALDATLLVFGEIHLLTLAFGASTIGICIDYTMHLYAERLEADPSMPPAEVLARVRPGITLGMLTSVVAWAGLLLPPFPGLRQMAVFASVGLIAAWLTVIYLLPGLIGPARHAPDTPLRLADALLRRLRAGLHQRRVQLALGAIGLTIAAVGLPRLRTSDDARRLNSPDPALYAQEQRAGALLGSGSMSAFFLVEGQSGSELMEHEEALLDRLKNLGVSAVALSQWSPSPARQQADNAALQREIVTPGLLGDYLLSLGYLPAEIAEAEAAVRAGADDPLDFYSWLPRSPIRGLSSLYLGKTERGIASAVLVGKAPGVDHQTLAELATELPDVHFVDTLRNVETIFARYRRLATGLVLAAYGLIAVSMLARFGLRLGAAVLLPPAAAATVVLAGLGIAGVPLNIFHLLGLLLVLGIGIDYTLFFAVTRERPSRATFLAILMSAVTTILAFGLLAFSDMPVLQAFGGTLMPGILLALLLAPLASAEPKAAGST